MNNRRIIETRKRKVFRCNYGCAFWCHVFFSSYLNGITERYPELFEEGTVVEGARLRYNFNKKWIGYSSIHQLAGGDILNYKDVLALPLEQCFLFLAYEADKSTLDNMLHREMLKKYKS